MLIMVLYDSINLLTLYCICSLTSKCIFSFQKDKKFGTQIFVGRTLLCVFILGSVITLSVNLHSAGKISSIEIVLLPLLILTLAINYFQPLQKYLFHSLTSPAQRDNVSVVSVIVRCVVTLTTTVMLMTHTRDSTISLEFAILVDGFKQLSNNSTLVTMVSFQIVFSFTSQIVLIVKQSRKYLSLCIYFIIFLSQWLSVGFSICMCVTEINISFVRTFKHGCEISSNNVDIVIYILAVAALVCPFVIFVMNVFFSDREPYKESETDDIMHTTRYSSIFITQTNLCNSRICSDCSDGQEGLKSINNNKNSRVFICTTMYQEAEHEMERLLISLSKVLYSSKIRQENIVLESHIFLDNGAKDKDLNGFGKQLLGLIEQCFQLDDESGLLIYTPYGIQLTWRLENGTSIFLHLKDNSKVKAKKRWSQVMYLKYVLDYKSQNIGRSMYYDRKASTYTLASDIIDLGDESYYNTRNFPHQTTFNIPSRSVSYPDIVIHGPEMSESRIFSEVEYSRDSGIEETKSDIFMVDHINGSDTTGATSFNDFLEVEIPTEIHTRDRTLLSPPSYAPSSVSNFSFLENTDDFILMTDADMSFGDDDVLNVLKVCQSDTDIGGVCGRTYPIGLRYHPIIWLQMFDYAKGILFLYDVSVSYFFQHYYYQFFLIVGLFSIPLGTGDISLW